MRNKKRLSNEGLMGLALALAGSLATPAFAQSGAGTGGGGGTGMGKGAGASANAGVYVIKLEDGVSKRQTLQVNANGMVRATRNLGAGNEHAAFALDGSTIVVVHASNNIVNTPGPSAIKCVSLDMHADGPPTVRARAQFTYSNSDRLGHPAIASNGAGKFVVAYGANNVQGNGNTQTYSLVTDKDCKDLTSHGAAEEGHVKLSQDDNNNIAAPRLVWDGAKFVGGIYKNNDAEYGFTVGITPDAQGGFAPKLLSDNQRLTPSNIGRPNILVLSPTRALYAAPKGQQRPSERGDEVALLNTDPAALVQDNNGNTVMPVLWRKVVVQASPDQNNIGGIDGLPGPLGGKGVYPASPSLAATEVAGEVYLTTFISSGEGRNRNKKGSSSSYVARLGITDTGFTKIAEQTDIGLESSHIVTCAGKVGIVGSEVHALAVYGAPITSFGSSSLAFVRHDPVMKAFPMLSAAAVSPTNSDGGYLSNMLGRNPAQQGREHLNCQGDVPNLAYGTGTFMPKVKTFFVAPWNGRVNLGASGTAPLVQAADGRMLPEDRNALFMSFIAGVRDADAPAPAAPPASQPNSGNNSTGSGGDTIQTPGTPGSDTPAMAGGFSGGCSYGGSGSSGALALLFVGGALLFISRRRWT